jgi:multidrug efflux system outer membrane protein
MKRQLLLSLAVPIALAGCSSWLPVRHDTPELTHSAPLPSFSDATAANEWPANNWWQRYQDDTLNSLVTQALASAPSIATAEARFSSAREAARVSAATAGLRVDAQAAVARQRLSDNGLFPSELLGFSWYNQGDLGLKASYSFDWWHKQRDTTAAALDEVRAAQAEQSAASIALTASIADSYFGWQGDQAQLALIEEQLQLISRRQQITAARIAAQLDAPDTQYQLDIDSAALRGTRIELTASAQLRRIVIAALLGISPEQLPEFVAKPLPDVHAGLPESARIDLLARRADIVAARWRIDSAEKHLQAARAEFMPDFSINALAALSSIDLGKLFDFGSRAPSVGAAVHLPIFDSGLLRAQYGARAAQVDAAVTNYNNTVITAARDVATQAITMQKLAAQRAERLAQVNAAQQQLSSAEARKQQGLSDARPVLLARQALQQQRAAITNLNVAALSADINLQLALGGGYATAQGSSD